MKKFSKGFTLIELLVVIAIIGILSSVVLASLNTARGKGADAAIKANLNNIRAQAEIYYDGNSSSYGTAVATNTNAACTGATVGLFSDNTIKQALTSASAQGGSATLDGTATQSITCGNSTVAWAVAIVLKTDAAQAWCVDSLGRAKQVAVTALDGADEFKGCE